MDNFAQKLEEEVAVFKEVAAKKYVQRENGHYIAGRVRVQAPMTEKMRVRDMRADFEYAKDPEFYQDVTAEHLEQVEARLSALGLELFELAGEGSEARCYLAKEFALRVGPMPKKPMPSRTQEKGFVRHVCPLVLQPYHKIHVRDAHVNFEVLQFVPVFPNTHPISYVCKAFTSLLPKMLDQTCFEVNNEDRDLAVLPDGTPVYVDPGSINLKSWERQPTPRDFEIIRENTQKLNLPEPFSWVLPDGRFKQDLFFPKPANAIDLTI